MSAPAWPCGHPHTTENTQSVGKAGYRCRECRRAITRRWARRNAEKARRRYLPDQIDAARAKVRALENEARRYGMIDLLETRP